MIKSRHSVLRRAEVFQSEEFAGYLEERTDHGWIFVYAIDYKGIPVSLTLPVRQDPYLFETFPPVFEGLLPEGPQLEALLKIHKIDRHNAFAQLVVVGGDLVGSLTVRLPAAIEHETNE